MTQSDDDVLFSPDNSSIDPLSPNNDPHQPGGLLDGTTGSLVSQMMGVTVIAPKPEHSVDPIKKFNALDAMLEGIADRTFAAFDTTDDKNWMAGPASSDPDAVVGVWRNDNIVPVQQDAVADWITSMGWGKKVQGGGGGVTMTAGPPGKMLDHFEEYFLASPGITAAA